MTRQIEVLQARDLEELLAFARPFERDVLAAYPQIPVPSDQALRGLLEWVLAQGHGVISRSGDEVLGYLAVIGPFGDYHGGKSGVFSPLFANLVSPQDADRIFTEMLTALAEMPVLAGVDTMAVSICPHHRDHLASASLNGFGIRCSDAVQDIDALPMPTNEFPYEISEVHWRDAVSIIEAKRSLAEHLTKSPVYMEYFDFSPEFVAWKSEQRQSVHLVARDGDHIIGFIEATLEGENYLTNHPQMRNICGAGVLPQYRGQGIMRELLARLAERYRPEGIITLGVDYETMNPNARGFWERYFVPYTRSGERRFDCPWSGS
ncbi:MAG: GNAT family N-acetyltransferase [Thermomicrobiales bacterium]|nr:GNAT family N-acetyltransferase [Thermomicrobiales bacterium]